MRAVVVLNALVEELLKEGGRKGLLDYFNQTDIAGEDSGMVKRRPLSDQFSVKEMLVRYRDFRYDSQGNITADVILYGWLRDTPFEKISYVTRAFKDDVKGKFFIAGIDVNIT